MSVKVDKTLARELGCQVGDEWVQISGLERWGQTVCPLRASVFVVPEYGSIANASAGALARFMK